MRTSSFSALDHISEPVRFFIGNRLAELAGLALLVVDIACALSLLTWSVLDPSLDHATSGPIHNLLGKPGAIVADLVTQLLGVASVAMLVPIAFWG